MKFKKTIIGISIISMVIGSISLGLGLIMGGSFHALQISMGVDHDGFFFRHYGDIEYEDTTLKDITSLTVDMGLGSITMIEEDREDIQIRNMIKERYTLDIKNEKATLKVNGNSGFSFFNFGNEYSQDIEILVPLGFQFDNLNLYNAMGDITLDDIQATTLSIDVDLGDVEANNITSDSFMVNNAMGNVTLDDIQATSLSIEVDLGDVEANNITSDSSMVNNAMGNIELDGTFLNETNIHNDLGDVDVRVRDDIRNYDYETECSLGEIKVNGKEGNTSQSLQSKHKITITNSMGDITLDFDL